MLLANKEAVMTVLDTLNFVAFNPLQNNNPIAVRRRKLIAKINEQIETQKSLFSSQLKSAEEKTDSYMSRCFGKGSFW